MLSSDRFKESATFGMENNMTRNITAILAAAVVLTSAGVASAQTKSHSPRTVTVGQSSEAVMPDRASAAIKLPSYELMGFPISQHQFSILGSANIKEQSPSPSLMMAGIPASPHQVAVLTPRARTIEALPAPNPIATVSFPTR